jgi:hypothetical protein
MKGLWRESCMPAGINVFSDFEAWSSNVLPNGFYFMNRRTMLLSPHLLFVKCLLASLLAFGIMLFGASVVLADVGYWVDGIAGDDDNSCRRFEPAEPPDDDDDDDDDEQPDYTYFSCRTIGRALEVAAPGDTIHVAGRVTTFDACPPAQFPTAFLYTSLSYNETLVIGKEITIKGGYCPGFGQFIAPPQDLDRVPVVIQGSPSITIRTQTLLPQLDPPPM